MKRLIFGLLLALTPTTVSAEPLCYMQTASGANIDLTSMCSSGAKQTTTVAVNSKKPGINLDDPERRIKIGETSGGLDIVFDRDSVSPKTFDLKIVTSAGTRNFEFEYACGERRVFLERVSITSNATGKTYKVSNEGGAEMKFEQNSAAELGLQLACRQSKSPGY